MLTLFSRTDLIRRRGHARWSSIDPEEFFKEVFRDAEGFGMHQSGRGGTRGMPPGGVHFAFNGFPMGGAQPIPLELHPVIKAILGIVPFHFCSLSCLFVTVLFSRLMSFAFLTCHTYCF